MQNHDPILTSFARHSFFIVYCSVSYTNAIVVSDAHLGQASPEAENLFHRFLTEIPDRTKHLVINGDLFEFWFEYPDVIPRKSFRTLSYLRQVTDAGVRLTVLGGNHDRWGRDFWADQLGAEFHRRGARIEVAGWKAFVHHGDGLIESEPGGRWLHRITGMPITEAIFRAIHPTLGFKIIRRLSRDLADRQRTDKETDALATTQTAFAKQFLEDSPDIELVILGHTHRAVVEEFGARKHFLNPGAWLDGGAYAEVTHDGGKLLQYK